MARTRVRYVDAPPRNDVYVGMLVLSLVAMVIGCAVLADESSDYDWSTEVKAGTAPALPTPTVPAAAPRANPPVTPPAGGPAPAPSGGTSQVVPKPIDPPTAVAATPPAATPPAALPPEVPGTNASIKTAAPRPGFNPNLPRK